MKSTLKSSNTIKRCEYNPILKGSDCPYPSDLVFNPGVVKWKDKYVMIFRNDYGYDACTKCFEGTNLGLAYSDDGIKWEVQKELFFSQDMITDNTISRFYDPRLIVIENELYMCFAVDSEHGVRGGIGKVSDDLKNLEILNMSVPDNRNFVLFPEKIDGMYVRLERPMPIYGRATKERGRIDRFDIWISKSPDLKYWGEHELLLGVEHVPYSNDKIGPAAPPIKTDKGWLTLFHSVDLDTTREKNGWEDRWSKQYSVGIMLLDLKDPSKVIGMSKEPLIAPEAEYEIEGGFRNNVIFPCAMIDEEDGTVKIYYGASDAVICLACANIEELINECSEKK